HGRWLNQASILVVSQTLQEPVAWGERGKTARVIRSVDAIAEAKTQTGADLVAIGSAQLAKSLVQHALVDDYWLFINPVMLGNGLPLFAERDQAQKLELVDTRRFADRVVQ